MRLRSNRTDYERGTWIEHEEKAYGRYGPKFGRKCMAMDAKTGELVTVRCSVADTYFSIPGSRKINNYARKKTVRGFVSIHDDGYLTWTESRGEIGNDNGGEETVHP